MYSPHYQYQMSGTLREITVTGNGEVAAQPDLVQIQLEVRTEGNTVSAAQQENAIIMNRVIDSILNLNIRRDAIQTTNFRISPLYDFSDGGRELLGYEVENGILVKIEDITQAGLVIDTAVQNGANQVSSIQFAVIDDDYYYEQALSIALINAIGKAKSLADTMQVPIQLTPIEIVEEFQHAAPVPFKSAQIAAREVVTPIEKGTMNIQASLRVKFKY